MKLVPATCHQGLGFTLSSVLLEPVSFTDGQLLTSQSLVAAFLPVVDVGNQDQWLRPKTMLGELHVAMAPVPNSSIHFEHQKDHSKQVVFIQLVNAEGNNGAGFSQLDWPTLSDKEQQDTRALLEKYSGTFSQGDGDLGCTTLVQQTIPLLDDAPV